MKDLLKKYLPLFGVVLFPLLIINLLINHTYTGFFYYTFLVLHSLAFCASVFLFFNPTKSIIYGIAGICYLPLLVFSPTNEIIILICYILILVSFWNQGFFVRKRIPKRIFAAAGISAVIVIRIILLKKEYLHRLYENAPVLFIAMILFTFVLDSYRFEKILKTKFVINLNEYDKLSARQKKLTAAILNDVKYETFATENGISSSSVKKDAVSIFKEFSCSSKNIFILKFSQYDFYLDDKLVYKGK